MKFLGNFLVWFFVFLFIGNLALVGWSFVSQGKTPTLSSVVSPLPKFFENILPRNVSASDFWEPTLKHKQSPLALELTAVSALSYDTTTNQVIYAKNIESRLPIASLTKIMTAIVALEKMDVNQEITVSKSAAEIGESSMGLSEGEKLQLKDLMYGLILNSGNDAAEAIAQASEFGREGYVHIMNKKAEDMGLSNTRFTNTSGLQGDGEQYSTAKELLVITRYALQNPTFAEIAATYQHDIPETPTNKAYTLYNETNLLTTYPGVKGVKTGFTDEAGMCLVTYLDYQGHKIIAVILNSQNRRQEMKDLLDYSLASLNITPPPYNP